MEETSEQTGAVDSSYDENGYKPKPYCNFFDTAVKALLKCLGVETPSNTDTATTEQVDDESAATSVAPVAQADLVTPGVTPPPGPKIN